MSVDKRDFQRAVALFEPPGPAFERLARRRRRHERRRRLGAGIAAVIVIALAAALIGRSFETTVPGGVPSTPSPTAIIFPFPTCNDPDPADKCLGLLGAGTYTTQQFQPSLTYTVPDGWSNTTDLPLEFMLLPPGADLAGVDPGKSDYIGVYSSVAAPRQDCSGRPDETVPSSAEAYVSWLEANPALDVSNPVPIAVGTHAGTSVHVALGSGTGPCHDRSVGRFAEFAVGVPPAHRFSAGVTPTLDYVVDAFDVDQRLFLILIADPKGRGSDERSWPATAERIASEFSF